MCSFDLAMDPNIDIAETSTCTTCRFVEDKSNYWTAVLYFKHRNGSYYRVPQMANHNTGPGYQAGGMTVYYFQPRPPTKNLNVVAFAKGFRMITGNPMRRSNADIAPNSTEYRTSSYRCFEGADLGFGVPGGADSIDTFDLPNRPCSGGIRSNIFFPQCWDGVNLDTPDHSSHVAHPVGGIFGTDCPDSHPVRLPLLFIEIVWDTRSFNDPDLWPEDGSQPFVFSMGDPTGYGQHADYVFGWEGDSLQRAMEVCTNSDGIPTNCPVLTVQDTDAMNNCRLPAKVPEVVEDAYLSEMPGCNPIQAGPEPATMVPDCTAVSTTIDAPLPTGSPAAIIPPWQVCHDGSSTDPLVPRCDSIPVKEKRDVPAVVTPL
ncbi:hypothetical protein CC1G_15757 [Coprinopsis cinerea okayama7|uniref:DUF1996 domain-containing protein n=1 Tax=Coprinopsis cinerea (strain Okayama-7 / 130 / ATCC MYA-4618 / FGSC 9003) TaxID=240176 RepID=D6RQX1_COPC7|nr:hypothetical protein CC1G_15757 [Coprinopsis cinerea okayama7\|eukprot:XP_002910038.1 hypothetical protein CC1G_15757 [Coprinopsis cinerea okayama7\